MNRLGSEKSPYLLQHAQNPVDWFPWGDEAFDKARKEDKPVFLSVGYSTCHWCHVMERESFENPDIARLLNRDFVSIKVDREERPDVDRIYMLFVQAATGSGGWPMSVFLTPERKPFFGGTYFPPDNRYGRPGFAALLQSLAQAWQKDRTRVEQSGEQVIGQLQQLSDAGGEKGERSAGIEALEAAYNSFRRMFDRRLGGFGGAPKFPRPSVLNFLLRYHARTNEEEALEMVLVTLREMAKGGMNDQLGGGFHRYSVDEHWFVPHFEKMLYDQAQLAVSYLEAFQITGEALYADVARSVFEYVLRDLAHPEGGFYSAEDADSAADPAHPHEKGEGAFYIWTHAELVEALGAEAAAIFARRYGVEERGNVHEDPHGEFGGRNILYQDAPLHRDLEGAVEQARQSLLAIRSRRPRPHLDDKILTAWNAMMISALAKGARVPWNSSRTTEPVAAGPRGVLDLGEGRDGPVPLLWNSSRTTEPVAAGPQGVLDLGEGRDGPVPLLTERGYGNEPRYQLAARKAIDFLRLNLWRESDATLLRRYRDGDSAIEGFLDDYAFLALALIDMYETTFEAADLRWAERLAERAQELFEDREHGGFFSTEAAKSDLVLRLKDDYDGAEPSGNSAMALALLKLARLTGREDFRVSADRMLQAFAPRFAAAPTAAPQMLVAQMFAVEKPMEIVFAGPRNEEAAAEMLKTIYGRFLPAAVVMRAEQAPTAMPAVDGKPTVYICENYACKLPVTDDRALQELLQ